MESKKSRYKYLDIARVLFCIAILLYHLKLLKGGYLAVCSFFALSGYLSCISAFKKDDFSLKSYYLSRLKKIYLPLAIVVFITVAITHFIKDVVMLNLKPEVMSILFGYNNFWQLTVNLDYFAHHVDSPFMHLWYVSILLQFELIFPIIFIPLKKLGDNRSKAMPCIIILILGIIGSIYFYVSSSSQNMMSSYYSTFTRAFSLLFGLSLGFAHSYYKADTRKARKKGTYSKMFFYICVIVLVFLFCTIDATSSLYRLSMIAATFLTCILINYATTLVNNTENTSFDGLINSLSGISYELYLLQYPIIFIFQYTDVANPLKIPLTIITLLISSYLLHYALSANKNKNKSRRRSKTKNKTMSFKNILRIILVVGTIFGFIQFCVAKDTSAEMRQLQEELARNELMAKQKQEEFERKYKEEQEKLQKMLEELENDESKLKDVVDNLHIVGIGDSVLLGVSPTLYKTFTNGYFDGKVSRSPWVLNDILIELKNKNMLGDPILINLGANGDCSTEMKHKIMATCGDRKVFWVTVTNDKSVHVNDKLRALAEEYDNLEIIDWNAVAQNHPEYLVSDKVHLTSAGIKAYVNTVYNAIYESYAKEYTNKKAEIKQQYDEMEKNKTDFYDNNGNTKN